MYSPDQIGPAVSFRNSQGQQVRGTIITLQRRALVMEIYNPYSVVQVSEVLSELAIKMGTRQAYFGETVVVSLVDTGLTAVVSLTLTDERREPSEVADTPVSVDEETRMFVQEWQEHFRIHRDYQIAVNEMCAFLVEVSRRVEQVDLSKTLSREDNKLRMDILQELAKPIMLELKGCMDGLESEVGKVEAEPAPAHRTFAQAALYPLLLRASLIYRTYTKPLGYTGDYEMVNQILSDPHESPNTYFQIVNAAFLRTDVAKAHRNRIDILVQYLSDLAAQARAAGRAFKVLNMGCGSAMEIQRFIQQRPEPSLLAFELVDSSEETLDYTREQVRRAMDRARKTVTVDFVHESVHQLLKRRVMADSPQAGDCDAVYCVGLFDYLSNKVCQRLLACFASRTRQGGAIPATNVRGSNPMRFIMKYVLGWCLVYHDEPLTAELLPEGSRDTRVYTDVTGVSVFTQASVAGLAKSAA